MSMIEDINTLSDIESDDFWANAKCKLFLNKITKKEAYILDVGCGTGLLSSKFVKEGHYVDAIDLSENSVEKTKSRMRDISTKNIPNVWLSTIESLNTTKKYDYIIFADILEHIEDDNRTLNKAYDLLKDDGRLLISVPAIKMLYGKHDIYCEHVRRYSKNEICNKLIKNKFTIKSIKYWNMLMIPLASFYSKILNRCYPHSKVNSNKKLNKLLEFYYNKFENKINSPIGLSLFIIARK